jgi:hypothetical protein
MNQDDQIGDGIVAVKRNQIHIDTIPETDAVNSVEVMNCENRDHIWWVWSRELPNEVSGGGKLLHNSSATDSNPIISLPARSCSPDLDKDGDCAVRASTDVLTSAVASFRDPFADAPDVKQSNTSSPSQSCVGSWGCSTVLVSRESWVRGISARARIYKVNQPKSLVLSLVSDRQCSGGTRVSLGIGYCIFFVELTIMVSELHLRQVVLRYSTRVKDLSDQNKLNSSLIVPNSLITQPSRLWYCGSPI